MREENKRRKVWAKKTQEMDVKAVGKLGGPLTGAFLLEGGKSE